VSLERCKQRSILSGPATVLPPGDRDHQGNQGARGDLVIGGKEHATHKVSMKL
jgi:hypothetical protein